MAQPFTLVAPFALAGDQPKATEALAKGILRGDRAQTLLGVTGSGKTMAMARTIELVQKPALVLCHNKTLAAQLCAEFREFFPQNAVEYFVSYFDYYQPEAYVPSTDTYIEKDSSINDEIERLRHSATQSLLTRRDTLIVASVSCIFGLGSPSDYMEMSARVRVGETLDRDALLRKLVDMQYRRNDVNLVRGTFRVRGDTLEFIAVDEELVHRIEFFGDEIEAINVVNLLTGEYVESKSELTIFPAKHFITPEEKLQRALVSIEAELEERLGYFRRNGKLLEAQRLETRTRYDLDMLREVGYCNGIENYSRHLTGREAGSTPWCLIDFFPNDWLLFVDESHVTLPQVHGMYAGDRSRKEVLVKHGFRLPSARQPPADVRRVRRTHPAGRSCIRHAWNVRDGPQRAGRRDDYPATGLVDPEVDVRPTRHQVDDLMEEIAVRAARHERVLVTTLTKKMAEDLTEYLVENGLRVRYLHSEVDTLERVAILRDLRSGVFDVLVGINLLREGLDLPEVSLVGILDADKEGYLRSGTSLIQTIGRASRNVEGKGHHVRRRRHRIDGARDRRDAAAARDAGGVQPRARHRAEIGAQTDSRHSQYGRRNGGKYREAEARPPAARRRAEDGRRPRAQDARSRRESRVRSCGAARRAHGVTQGDRRQRRHPVRGQGAQDFRQGPGGTDRELGESWWEF